jgi:hypothetical protein
LLQSFGPKGQSNMDQTQIYATAAFAIAATPKGSLPGA